MNSKQNRFENIIPLKYTQIIYWIRHFKRIRKSIISINERFQIQFDEHLNLLSLYY